MGSWGSGYCSNQGLWNPAAQCLWDPAAPSFPQLPAAPCFPQLPAEDLRQWQYIENWLNKHRADASQRHEASLRDYDFITEIIRLHQVSGSRWSWPSTAAIEGSFCHAIPPEIWGRLSPGSREHFNKRRKGDRQRGRRKRQGESRREEKARRLEEKARGPPGRVPPGLDLTSTRSGEPIESEMNPFPEDCQEEQ